VFRTVSSLHYLGGESRLENFPILLIIALCIGVYRLYSIRNRFKELNRREWIMYILGFILAFAVTCIVIMGGIHILKLYLNGFLYTISAFVLICIGLILGSFIFKQFIPPALKSFYKR